MGHESFPSLSIGQRRLSGPHWQGVGEGAWTFREQHMSVATSLRDSSPLEGLHGWARSSEELPRALSWLSHWLLTRLWLWTWFSLCLYPWDWCLGMFPWFPILPVRGCCSLLETQLLWIGWWEETTQQRAGSSCFILPVILMEAQGSIFTGSVSFV